MINGAAVRKGVIMERWILPYVIVNIVVFSMYGVDKYKAKHKKWRIPEATLLTAAVFGVLGAMAGMYFFRHKTKKSKFFVTVPVILVLEAILLVLFLWK